MRPNYYQRVDLARLSYSRPALTTDRRGARSSEPVDVSTRIRWWVIPLAALLCAAQAIITVSASNNAEVYVTSTLITVIGFAMLFAMVIALNPLAAWLSKCLFEGRWLQPLGRAELTGIFAALLISAGVSTFGLSDVLVPLIPAPWNPEWNTPQRGWDQQLLPHLRQELYITDADVIRQYREGMRDAPSDTASWRAWTAYYRRVATDIPWAIWLKPLGLWMVMILACYGVFFALCYLVLPLWSRREKLIFPLARLPASLLPPDQARHAGWVPQVMRSWLFWTGFLFAFVMLAYNGASIAGLIPLEKVGLGMSGGTFAKMARQSFFEGFGSLPFLIVFTCIGIGFLLPLEISFSAWFYFLAGQTLHFILYRAGYRDFNSDWTWKQSPVASIGMGAILVFSAVVLGQAVRTQWRRMQKTNHHKRSAALIPLAALIVCALIVTAWLTWNRIPVIWSAVITLFLVLTTVGLMRIVAEGGVFWIQTNATFFHFYKMLGLGKVLAPVVLAPLIPIYAILFFDIKTFIAPNILNAAKMHQDVGGNRLRYHLVVGVSLAVSIVTAIGYSLLLAYGRGAQRMNAWFYSQAPLRYMERANQAVTMHPQVHWNTFGWFTFGAVWVALSMFLRRTLFWFPHPVGFIMNINPLMRYLWFSFFLAWVIKKLVISYGGRQSFDKVRDLMIGLIVGELVAICIAAVMTMLPYDIDLRSIDLNRYQP